MSVSEEPVREDEIVAWKNYIGRSETVEQYLDATSLARFMLALGGKTGERHGIVPPMAHWAYFLPQVANEDLGPDGHFKRGGFMPHVRLPRRMFAGGSTSFLRPLQVGRQALCTTTIIDVRHRAGRSGELVFVDLERRIEQDTQDRVIEKQSIVYRGQSATMPPVETREGALPEGATIWQPGPLELFRYSAVTFNGHRIHYDRPYTREVELYPDLVVHGPFTASMLCRLAAERAGKLMQGFSFNAIAPVFVSQPIALLAEDTVNGLDLRAIRQDGEIAMKATAIFRTDQQ